MSHDINSPTASEYDMTYSTYSFRSDEYADLSDYFSRTESERQPALSDVVKKDLIQWERKQKDAKMEDSLKTSRGKPPSQTSLAEYYKQKTVYYAGRRIYSTVLEKEGYVISPLISGNVEYVAVRFVDRQVRIYAFEDLIDNIYPLDLWEFFSQNDYVFPKNDCGDIDRYSPSISFLRVEKACFYYSITPKLKKFSTEC